MNPLNLLNPLTPIPGTNPAPSCRVTGSDQKKPYIDVMENVFGGVRISTDKEPRSRDIEPDLRGRPWLTGVSMSRVKVRLAEDDDLER